LLKKRTKRALLKGNMINVASVFKVLQSCGAGMACRKVLRHKIIHQVHCLPVTKLSLWFAPVRSNKTSPRCTDGSA